METIQFKYYAEFVVEVLDKTDFRSPVALAGNSQQEAISH